LPEKRVDAMRLFGPLFPCKELQFLETNVEVHHEQLLEDTGFLRYTAVEPRNSHTKVIQYLAKLAVPGCGDQVSVPLSPVPLAAESPEQILAVDIQRRDSIIP
jgi:hypothetical protein